MEDSLYHLQLDYLLLAREMVLSGQEEQAMFSLGLTPEAVGILKKLQVQQIREIARRECLIFTPRFNASFWGRYLQVDQSVHEGDTCDSQARDLLILLTGSGDIA